MRIRPASAQATHQSKEAGGIACRLAGFTAIFEQERFERRSCERHAVTQPIQARHTQLETAGQDPPGVTENPGNYQAGPAATAARVSYPNRGYAMDVQFIDHFTLSVRPHELEPLREFYTRTFGLTEGRRPDFRFPGHWLYLDGRPVVHLAANLPDDVEVADGVMSTGKFSHVSFRCKDVEGTRKRLTEMGVKFREAPVPGFPLHQIFVHDPAGLMIELTFAMPE